MTTSANAIAVHAPISSVSVFFTYCDSPIGKLLLAGDARALRVISLPNGRNHLVPADDWQQSDEPLHNAVEQLRSYFAGDLHKFELPVDPDGTEFQRQVWKALQAVPYGTTISYGELAKRLEKPKASRAVGAANGANPIPIVIPCHRVIGANGSLTGFGGGLEAKRWLLEHERALPESARQRELWG